MSNKYLFIIVIALSLGACKTTQKIQSPYLGEEQVKKDITFLASDKLEGRAVGTEGETLAAEYIAKRFKDIGLKPMGDDKSWFQGFSFEPRLNPHAMGPVTASEKISGKNVVGWIDNKADHTIIIGAHFDHLGWGGEGSLYAGEKAIHNGADDNASGVSGLLQLAATLSNNYKESNYLIIAFSGEERGLWGSNYFSKNPTVDLEKVNFMINLDMIGRLQEDRGLAVNGTGTSPVWKRQLEKANKENVKLIMSKSGTGPSDHTSFYLQDIPVLHFFTGQHEDYHKPSDDFDKINFEGITKVVGIVDHIVGSLHDEAAIAFTSTDNEDQQRSSAPAFSVTLGVMPDYLFDGTGMRIDGVKDGRPAHNAGIMKGDIVIQMGDIKVADMMSYMEALGSFEKGDTTIVKIKREGQLMSKEVTF